MEEHRITILVVSNEYPRPYRPSNPIVQRLIAGMRSDERVEHVEFVPFTNNITDFGKIRKAAKKSDVLQIHFGGIYAFLVWLAVIGIKVPKYITFHGTDIHMGELAFESNPLKRLKIRLNQKLSFISLFCFDGCGFVDEALIGYIPERLRIKTKHKYYVSRLGVDFEIFHPMSKMQARKMIGIDSGKFQVLFSDLAGYQIKRRDLAEKIIHELGQDYELLIMSRVNPDLVPVFLSASDFLLLTSATEGSPNIVREALALNVPVFSVDVGDVAQQIAGLKKSSIIPRDPMKAAHLIKLKMERNEEEDTRTLLRRNIDIELITRKVIDKYINYDERKD